MLHLFNSSIVQIRNMEHRGRFSSVLILKLKKIFTHLKIFVMWVLSCDFNCQFLVCVVNGIWQLFILFVICLPPEFQTSR